MGNFDIKMLHNAIAKMCKLGNTIKKSHKS